MTGGAPDLSGGAGRFAWQQRLLVDLTRGAGSTGGTHCRRRGAATWRADSRGRGEFACRDRFQCRRRAGWLCRRACGELALFLGAQCLVSLPRRLFLFRRNLGGFREVESGLGSLFRTQGCPLTHPVVQFCLFGGRHRAEIARNGQPFPLLGLIDPLPACGQRLEGLLLRTGEFVPCLGRRGRHGCGGADTSRRDAAGGGSNAGRGNRRHRRRIDRHGRVRVGGLCGNLCRSGCRLPPTSRGAENQRDDARTGGGFRKGH